ncbi:hypothetical protein CLV75_0980 [Ruegeria conchae]|uniref:Uncharacterized protein n=1 Tax=Ruegeria conchae TaxID=981384 RepID=A0A497ZNK7_9RHOB|nr:hypothetical protein CLV75_0980 [Ruegeria conchae]
MPKVDLYWALREQIAIDREETKHIAQVYQHKDSRTFADETLWPYQTRTFASLLDNIGFAALTFLRSAISSGKRALISAKSL